MPIAISQSDLLESRIRKSPYILLNIRILHAPSHTESTNATVCRSVFDLCLQQRQYQEQNVNGCDEVNGAIYSNARKISWYLQKRYQTLDHSMRCEERAGRFPVSVQAKQIVVFTDTKHEPFPFQELL